MAPQRADLVLPAHVPHVELDVLVRDGLDVEADGGDCGDVLVELEFVEDCWRGWFVLAGCLVNWIWGCGADEVVLSEFKWRGGIGVGPFLGLVGSAVVTYWSCRRHQGPA